MGGARSPRPAWSWARRYGERRRPRVAIVPALRGTADEAARHGARARGRPGLLLARVPCGLRRARVLTQSGDARRRRAAARRARLLHEPRLAARAGARRGGGGRLRRVQPRGRSCPSVEFGWATGRRGHHLRRPDHAARWPSSGASSGPSPTGLGARHRAARRGGGAAAARGQAAVRRAAEPRVAGRPDGRPVAPGRPAARVPRRRAHRGLDVGRPRRHGDRPAHRALLGSAHAQLRPHARLVGHAARRGRGRLVARGLVADGGAHRRRPGAAGVGRGGHRRPVRRSWSTRSASAFDELVGVVDRRGARPCATPGATRRRDRTTWPRCADPAFRRAAGARYRRPA